VCYPGHPWHGRAVWVFDAIVRNDRTVFRCGPNQNSAIRSLEVPQGMFEPAQCCSARIAVVPVVGCEALRELSALLQQASLCGREIVLKAQHRSLPSSEVLMQESLGRKKTVQLNLFHTPRNISRVARTTAGGSAEDGGADGTPVARACAKTPCPRQRKGGKS